MKPVSSGLRDRVNLTSGVIPVFGVEVVGQNPELGDRVKIGNDGGSLVNTLIDVAPIHHEPVGRFSLPAHGKTAGIQAAAGHRILIFSNRDLRGEAIRIFDRTFAITYALEAVAIVVAVMGVAGALLSLVIDRRRELGLLRFLGSSTAQIRKLVLIEAGLLGLLANIAGVVLGFAMSLVLIFVINKQSFGWTIRFHWPVALLLGALTLVYIATVIAGLYPAQVAARLNPLAVVHDE